MPHNLGFGAWILKGVLMVTDAILDLLQTAASGVIALLPTLDLTQIPAVNLIAWLIQLFDTVAYVLPITGMLTPFLLWIAIKNFHFGWKVIQRIWDAIPFI